MIIRQIYGYHFGACHKFAIYSIYILCGNTLAFYSFFYHFFLSLMYVLLFFTFLSLFATFARFLGLRISVSVSLSVCAVFVVSRQIQIDFVWRLVLFA